MTKITVYCEECKKEMMAVSLKIDQVGRFNVELDCKHTNKFRLSSESDILPADGLLPYESEESQEDSS